jgi:hypothetical protein
MRALRPAGASLELHADLPERPALVCVQFANACRGQID